MISSRAHRASAGAVRLSALAIALALALGGSRPAAALPVVKGILDGSRDGLPTNRGVKSWNERRIGEGRRTGLTAGPRRRAGFLRGPTMQLPGWGDPQHRGGGAIDPVDPRPGFSLGGASPAGPRHPERQIAASRLSSGFRSINKDPLGIAAARRGASRALEGASAALFGGARSPHERTLAQRPRPAVRRPLEAAGLQATGERLAVLSRRARGLLYDAAAAMNMNRSAQRPYGAGSLAALNPRMQDDYVRRHYQLACAGRHGDMKPLDEKLRALPGWEAWVAREHQSGHGTTKHGVQQRLVPTMPTPVLAAGGLLDLARPLILMN